MKANLTKVTAVLGAFVAASGAAAVVAIGCGSGDDSTAPAQEGGSSDSTVDVSADAPGTDSAKPDAGDAGMEASNAADASDSGAASDANGASDSSDFMNLGDVQIDAPPLAQFPLAVIGAYCTHLMNCCITSQDIASPDQWNQDGDGGCAQFYAANSGAFAINNHGAALNSGLVGYDASAAVTCIREWQSFQCGTVQATSIQKVKGDCYGALIGTLGVGAGPCTDSLECQAGEYCAIGDAGTGTCLALGSAGQPCSDTKSSFDCDYLALGNPPLYCAAGDSGATCENTLALDASCAGPAQCQSGVCVLHCVNSGVLGGSAICRVFSIKDAGGGG